MTLFDYNLMVFIGLHTDAADTKTGGTRSVRSSAGCWRAFRRSVAGAVETSDGRARRIGEFHDWEKGKDCANLLLVCYLTIFKFYLLHFPLRSAWSTSKDVSVSASSCKILILATIERGHITTIKTNTFIFDWLNNADWNDSCSDKFRDKTAVSWIYKRRSIAAHCIVISAQDSSPYDQIQNNHFK